jgi:hypothetical protein
MNAWLACDPGAAETDGWSSSLAISGMAIPAMLMPFIFILEDDESWGSAGCTWQSDFIDANAQERSHAAASEGTDSSSATIEAANMRLIIMPISILRQSVSALQTRLAGRSLARMASQNFAATSYFTLLFSVQTYS